MKDSRDEVMRLLDLMRLTGKVAVADGADGAIPDEHTPAKSPGAELIVREVLKDDSRSFHVAFLGPLVDMTSAQPTSGSFEDRGVADTFISLKHRATEGELPTH